MKKVTLEYLQERKSELESKIEYQKRCQANLTVAILEKELEVVELAIEGIKSR